MSRFTNRNSKKSRGSCWLPLFLVFLLFFSSLPVFAQSDVGYLIVDQTKTPWGHRFYRTFTEIWKPPKGIDGYFIFVKEEKPTFKQSWIVILVGDNIYKRKVFVALLKPTTSNFDMQKYAVAASKRILRFLLTDYLRFKMYENTM